jgi:hypothetical protein
MQIISSCSSPYFQKKQSQPVKFSGIHLEKQPNSVRVPDDDAGRNVWYTDEHKDIIVNAQPFLKLSEDDPKHQEHKQKIIDLVALTRSLFPVGGKAEKLPSRPPEPIYPNIFAILEEGTSKPSLDKPK